VSTKHKNIDSALNTDERVFQIPFSFLPPKVFFKRRLRDNRFIKEENILLTVNKEKKQQRDSIP